MQLEQPVTSCDAVEPTQQLITRATCQWNEDLAEVTLVAVIAETSFYNNQQRATLNGLKEKALLHTFCLKGRQ